MFNAHELLTPTVPKLYLQPGSPCPLLTPAAPAKPTPAKRLTQPACAQIYAVYPNGDVVAQA